MFNTHSKTFRTAATLVPLGAFAIVASFGLGMQTAGDLRAINESSATETLRGDVTGDGTVDERDATIILEIAQGYRKATPAELAADPNDNGVLTVDDAIRVLRTLSPR